MRRKICSLSSRDTNIINSLFQRKQMGAFWNKLKKSQKTRYKSNLIPENFATFYHQIMSDDGSRTNEQLLIDNFVSQKARDLLSTKNDTNIDIDTVEKLIKTLRKGTSPGIDGVQVEHLYFAISPQLCLHLANVYSIILSHSIVPEIFKTGILIPILKKPTLDTDSPENYRPVTLSTVHSKIIELLIIPEHAICETQFGFRKSRGTTFVTTILNDCIRHHNSKGSPVYFCGLDAEKCFDNIWHSGLLFKLWNVIKREHWLLLYKWYNSSCAQVRWNGIYSQSFRITKGMKQGSILSPYLFNIFINDLLKELKDVKTGVRISEFHANSLAYADDINILSTTASGLQKLIDACVKYADRWRFKFSTKKTKCVCFGKSLLNSATTWKLGQDIINLSDSVDVLGVNFDRKLTYKTHVQNRIQACRKNIYRLASVGMSYPGLQAEVKTYLWKIIGSPTLVYGMDSISLSASCNADIKTCEGNIIKRVVGMNKRSHHSSIFKALKIKPSCDIIRENTVGLYFRSFQVETPLLHLQTALLSDYLLNKTTITGTLIDRIVKYGLDPSFVAFNKLVRGDNYTENDGIVDSLRYLLFHENYIKPWSEEHILATLLTKSF